MLKNKARVVLGKDTGVKGTVIGYTIQGLKGSRQLYYIVSLDYPVTCGEDCANLLTVQVVLMHPDNIKTLHECEKERETRLSKNVYDFGQSNGDLVRIKSNAPKSYVDWVLWQIQRTDRELTAKRVVRMLHRRKWMAEIVNNKEALK